MPETSYDIETMSWPQVETALESIDAIVLPLGSTEQHSRHLPLAVDTLRADHLTAELVDRAPEFDLQLLRLPPLPYGYSAHHMRFPGTISIDAQTYTDVLVDIGRSLDTHGIDRLMVLNFHGGNREPIKLATDRLQRETDLTVHPIGWAAFAEDALIEVFGDDHGHAGEHETSVLEVYRPDLVDADRKEPQRVADRPETGRYAYFDQITEQGGLGDPTAADPAIMSEIIAETTEAILTAFRDDIESGW